MNILLLFLLASKKPQDRFPALTVHCILSPVLYKTSLCWHRPHFANLDALCIVTENMWPDQDLGLEKAL